MAGRLQDKVCLLSGAASGIGRACAEHFVREGAVACITDINERDGQALVSHLGKRSFWLRLDVRADSDWRAAVGVVLNRCGRLDCLVNNAGITGMGESVNGNAWGPQDPEHASLQSWHDVHATNLDGVFLGCKHAIAAMKPTSGRAGGGSIVNMSSRSGQVGISGAAAYASSKAAVRNHTKTVALYCAERAYGIRCNSVHPGAILTPMWEPLLGQGTERETAIARIAAGVPLGRMGGPDEVAALVVFLASDESAYITGAEFVIDGGILAGSTAAPQSQNT